MSKQCLPFRAGEYTFIVPMHWVINVQQFSDKLRSPPSEDEETLPLLDVSAWVGAPTRNSHRFAVVVGTEEQAVCLLVDGILPARPADSFTRLPALLQAVDIPFSALWQPDKSGAPFPVLDVPRVLSLATA